MVDTVYGSARTHTRVPFTGYAVLVFCVPVCYTARFLLLLVARYHSRRLVLRLRFTGWTLRLFYRCTTAVPVRCSGSRAPFTCGYLLPGLRRSRYHVACRFVLPALCGSVAAAYARARLRVGCYCSRLFTPTARWFTPVVTFVTRVCGCAHSCGYILVPLRLQFTRAVTAVTITIRLLPLPRNGSLVAATTSSVPPLPRLLPVTRLRLVGLSSCHSSACRSLRLYLRAPHRTHTLRPYTHRRTHGLVCRATLPRTRPFTTRYVLPHRCAFTALHHGSYGFTRYHAAPYARTIHHHIYPRTFTGSRSLFTVRDTVAVRLLPAVVYRCRSTLLLLVGLCLVTVTRLPAFCTRGWLLLRHRSRLLRCLCTGCSDFGSAVTLVGFGYAVCRTYRLRCLHARLPLVLLPRGYGLPLPVLHLPVLPAPLRFVRDTRICGLHTVTLVGCAVRGCGCGWLRGCRGLRGCVYHLPPRTHRCYTARTYSILLVLLYSILTLLYYYARLRLRFAFTRLHCGSLHAVWFTLLRFPVTRFGYVCGYWLPFRLPYTVYAAVLRSGSVVYAALHYRSAVTRLVTVTLFCRFALRRTLYRFTLPLYWFVTFTQVVTGFWFVHAVRLPCRSPTFRSAGSTVTTLPVLVGSRSHTRFCRGCPPPHPGCLHAFTLLRFGYGSTCHLPGSRFYAATLVTPCGWVGCLYHGSLVTVRTFLHTTHLRFCGSVTAPYCGCIQLQLFWLPWLRHVLRTPFTVHHTVTARCLHAHPRSRTYVHVAFYTTRLHCGLPHTFTARWFAAPHTRSVVAGYRILVYRGCLTPDALPPTTYTLRTTRVGSPTRPCRTFWLHTVCGLVAFARLVTRFTRRCVLLRFWITALHAHHVLPLPLVPHYLRFTPRLVWTAYRTVRLLPHLVHLV